MGLDTTHNCWHGSYSAFHDFRDAIARVVTGIPIDKMKGFGGMPGVALGAESWDAWADDPIVKLLRHSDSDGEIAVEDCLPIALRLEALAPKLGVWTRHAVRFACGLREAALLGEVVEFH